MRFYSFAVALCASMVAAPHALAIDNALATDAEAQKHPIEAKRGLAGAKNHNQIKREALINEARAETPEQSAQGRYVNANVDSDVDADNAPPPVETDANNAPPPAATKAPKSAGVVAVLSILERADNRTNNENIDERKALYDYYDSNVEDLIWITPDAGANERARALISELGNANDWGLIKSDFELSPSVTERIKASADASSWTVDERAETEVAISYAALKYARHARGGRIEDPSELLSSYLDNSPALPDVATVMTALRNLSQGTDAYLRSLHPQHEQFKKLRKALLAMRAGKAAEPKPEDIKLPTSGPLLRNGTAHENIVLLRKRLEVKATAPLEVADDNQDVQDFAENTPPEMRFDDELEAAVKAFQKENGLYTDGIVGPGTRRALNAGATDAITENVLIANMEAWRWMPDNLGDAYVTVNIPEYKVRFVKNGAIAHEERTIVGKTNNQTPIFSDVMKTVVFHPFWGVPNSIKVKELWPSLARGGSSFRRQGLRIQYKGRNINPDYVDWSTADIRKYHVYQPPGRSNVLGVVKFRFPNKHQVYLHDTPTKHLFKQTVRTYSHGCIRVRNPLRLAEVIMEHDKNWSSDDVQNLIDNGPENNEIKLETKIPVHITYFTAVVDNDGNVHRFKDVYGHEKRIKLALAGRFDMIAKGRDHLAPVRYERPKYAGPQSVNDIFQAIFSGF